ncbi:Enolase superfamily enzyme related to L-alanine-DL-glutamate epimerase [Candidatus Methylobacter favarea]|uniref:Enolase superfamily enzyme related to L-alanine-DL-glutamate epimerase n=1 Tax=Candidatus Methylobacter favarea TaxID=2707345 RepID=A0A8S0YAY7_9GAMM|nr:enolase C-terminal domain-like protein [Candidatus Methylobacter favarea]CAA9892787.1 Enolase superfamily enzyme related to L-alanine-DL-glutamate epimerase [Candidatus Methylobacter favarea]
MWRTHSHRFNGPPIDKLQGSAFRIPTATPESDGTLEWTATTLALVEARAAGTTGIGFSYADAATARLINDRLADIVVGCDALSVGYCWEAMVTEIRNLGRPGICSMAIAAVDNALWDLKARLLDLSLVSLLGQVRTSVPVYGSGGFTSYAIADLQEQLAGWTDQGIARVKMKIGREPEQDVSRVAAARAAIGPANELFVDANGAYSRKQALAMAQAFAEMDVSWFEEPVSSDDLEGLRLIRDRAPPGMDISAGEYGYDSVYFRRMLQAGAVDVLQADATRCAGITGFMQAAALCQAFNLPLSSHCAPSIHVHPCCAAQPVRHLEYFYDHMRIEKMLFDGALEPVNGELKPDLSRPGLGLEFKHADALRYAV